MEDGISVEEGEEAGQETHDEPDQTFMPKCIAKFDHGPNLKHTSKIAVLYQECHAALRTAIHLSDDEAHTRSLTTVALRMRIWGMNLFNAADYLPLDEILRLSGFARTSLKNHLTGVWADVAATLELILRKLASQRGELSPGGCRPWRRLTIVLGSDELATAVHDGFRLPGDAHSDSDDGYEDENEEDSMEVLIRGLESLVDCLFDLLVTIGTTRQLYKLGYKFETKSVPQVSNPEDTKEETEEDFENSSDSHHSSKSDFIEEIPREPRVSDESVETRRSTNSTKDQVKNTLTGSSSPSSLVRVSNNELRSWTPVAGDNPGGSSNTTPKRASTKRSERIQKPVTVMLSPCRNLVLPFDSCRTWGVSPHSS